MQSSMFPLISSHTPFNLYFVALVKNNSKYYDQNFPWREKDHLDPQQWPSSAPNKPVREKKTHDEVIKVYNAFALSWIKVSIPILIMGFLTSEQNVTV